MFASKYEKLTPPTLPLTSFAFYNRYGLPPLGPVPKGLTPLLEIWGKGKNRFPLLVLMNHPVTWVVTLPSNDVNGEDGTIQAGDYAKGDTATLFLYDVDGHVNVGEIPSLCHSPLRDTALITVSYYLSVSRTLLRRASHSMKKSCKTQFLKSLLTFTKILRSQKLPHNLPVNMMGRSM